MVDERIGRTPLTQADSVTDDRSTTHKDNIYNNNCEQENSNKQIPKDRLQSKVESTENDRVTCNSSTPLNRELEKKRRRTRRNILEQAISSNNTNYSNAT